MQTIEFVQTSKWIIAQFEGDTLDLILRGHFPMPEMRVRGGPLLGAAMNLAVSAERLSRNEAANEILHAFSLSMLLDREFALRIASLASELSERMRPDRDDPAEYFHGELPSIVRSVNLAWSVFERGIEPIENLTVPKDVIAETDFDAVLTLEMRYDENLHPKAETVASVLSRANTLYAVACRASGANEFPPLVVIYADSGSSVRFDLKGIGEPIKELKEFLVELWNRLRHRKSDDYRANADALLVGLKVVGALHVLEREGAISAEDVSRYKHDILESGVALFEAGAVPREIPRVEEVFNQRILAEVQRKLLPASPAAEHDRIAQPTAKVTGKTNSTLSDWRRSFPVRGSRSLSSHVTFL